MKRVVLSIVVGMYGCFSFGLFANSSERGFEHLDVLVTDWMMKANVPGLALARIENGAVAWFRVYGEASPGRPVTTKTPFNVASLTKPVFAVLTLHLVAQSKFELDAPLAKFWIDPDLVDDPRVQMLTTRMALSHQTGLPNWRGRNKLAFQFDPGKGTDYSGEGYEFLRHAIEAATGKALPELGISLKKAAGMTHASFGWTPGLANQLAVGYDETGKPIPNEYLKNRGPAAASSLFCTIEDYGHFAAWVSRGADLPESLFEMMKRDQAMHDHAVDHFGLGWRVVNIGDATVLAHDGREDGVRTQVYVVPEDQSGFVFLTNSSNGELMTRPLTQVVMPRGSGLLDAMDANAWEFASSIPPQVQPRMLGFIARSPAFVSRLLHGAEVHLIRSHFPGKKERSGIDDAIDAIALARLDGKLAPEPIQAFLESMGRSVDGGFQLASELTREDAIEWREKLLSLAKGSK